MALQVSGRSLLIGFHERTDTCTRLYTVPTPIGHNPGLSLPLIISRHRFYGYPQLSRSEIGPFSLAAREELTLLLEFWELYILYPGK